MPRDGNGNYSVPNNFSNGVLADANDVNENFNDAGQSLTNSLPRDGQAGPTANLPMGGHRHTNVGLANASNQYAVVSQIQNNAFCWAGTAGGTADALTLTLTPAITAYTAGQTFTFLGAMENTGAATVAINGLSAVAIQKNGVALTGGEIVATRSYVLLYTGSAFELQTFVSITDVLSGPLNTNGFAINESQGVAVPSSASPNIWVNDGNSVHITGNTAITDFANAPRIGATRTLIFDGILTLTHGSGITLPGGQDITTGVGDSAKVLAESLDAFRVVSYNRSTAATAIVGEIKDFFGVVSQVPTGWLALVDDTHTIGPAGSGATNASDSYLALFNHLWEVDDVTGGSAVQPSRGVSAAADWAAGKTILLPPASGRSSMGAGQGTGLVNRTLGQTFGEEGHVQTVDELANHRHAGVAAFGQGDSFGSLGERYVQAGNTGFVGASDPMNVIHPVFVVTKIMFAGA